MRPEANVTPYKLFNLIQPPQPPFALCMVLVLYVHCSVHPSNFLFPTAGSMTILPTVLFLITGVLRETALKAADNSVPLTVSAALQGIKTIITSPLAQVESIQTQWTSLVRSSLASVLEHSEPGEHTHSHSPIHSDFSVKTEQNNLTLLFISSMHACLFISVDDSRPDMDEVSMLTAVTLFLLSASNELVGVTMLQKGCMDRFRNALNSNDPWVSTCVHKLHQMYDSQP